MTKITDIGKSNINIKKRREIWLVLSEFYLDNELTNEDFKRIASVFKNSGLEIQTIKEIDKYEVFPLLQPNLLSVAGVWSGFNEAWLFENCEKQIDKNKNWFYKMKIKFWNRCFYWMHKDYWINIERLLNNNKAA